MNVVADALVLDSRPAIGFNAQARQVDGTDCTEYWSYVGRQFTALSSVVEA